MLKQYGSIGASDPKEQQVEIIRHFMTKPERKHMANQQYPTHTRLLLYVMKRNWHGGKIIGGAALMPATTI